MTSPSIKVGISSCLLGQQVRYNGGHKLSTLCTQELSRWFDFVPTCPEAGAGLGIPRPAVRLVGDPAAPRVVRVDDASVDFTAQLQAYTDARVPELGDLCGYIFIKNSPSCGLFRVKVYGDNGYPQVESSRGIFANGLTRAYPQLPVEEEGRLQDPVLRENFITRVFAWHNWRELRHAGLSAATLTAFHARYKYTLMAHAPHRYQELGRMLSDAGRHSAQELGARYFVELMEALRHKATRGTNTNVLLHLRGYLRTKLDSAENASIGDVIEQYRKGCVPLVVPVTLLRHYFRKHPDPYIERQAFLQPYPDELGLRNAL
jgi:uncharacterized protein YbgA (DUF1722 family)/uncharacterized protein YbbK (DUF523 family)